MPLDFWLKSFFNDFALFSHFLLIPTFANIKVLLLSLYCIFLRNTLREKVISHPDSAEQNSKLYGTLWISLNLFPRFKIIVSDPYTHYDLITVLSCLSFMDLEKHFYQYFERVVEIFFKLNCLFVKEISLKSTLWGTRVTLWII